MNVIPVDELMERILPPDRPRAFVAAFHVCGEAQKKKKKIAFRGRDAGKIVRRGVLLT